VGQRRGGTPLAVREDKEFLLPEVIRRPFSGALTSAAGLFALVIGLAAIDDRVRVLITRAFTGGGSSEISSFGSRMSDLALVAARAVRDQSIDHAPLAIFALAAGILVLLVTRT